MNFNNINADQITIDVNRREKENQSMVTISIYYHGLIMETYSTCELDLKAERTLAFFILNELEINVDAIRLIMSEDYFDDN